MRVKKKNPVNKNQGWEPIHQKYKANENTSRHNPKKKQKQTINKNHIKTLCKEDSRVRIMHQSTYGFSHHGFSHKTTHIGT